MKIVRLSGALGAEVSGLDLSRPLDEDTRQTLSPEQLIGFSRTFGELERHDNYLEDLRLPEYPELLVVRSTVVRGEHIVFGQQWHADLTYTLRPSAGAVLYCVELPPVGGDTLFANTHRAWETLSTGMRAMLEPLEAIHDLTNGRSYASKTTEQVEAARSRNPAVIQPVVRTHPVTGRKSLFISEWMCRRFEAMTEAESEGLLKMLFAHCARPEFTFRQCWQTGDVIVWDNASTVHMALRDYDPQAPRKLLRTSIRGEPSGRPLG